MTGRMFQAQGKTKTKTKNHTIRRDKGKCIEHFGNEGSDLMDSEFAWRCQVRNETGKY